MNDLKVTITKGPIKIELPKNGLMNITETSDGVIFKLEGGMILQVVDSTMPNTTKQLMSMSFMKIDKGNLTFNLLNYKNPVSISMID